VRKGKIADAEAILEEARSLIPEDPDNFSHVEQAHVEAETLFAQKKFKEALGLIDAVIARYAEDDLAGRKSARVSCKAISLVFWIAAKRPTAHSRRRFGGRWRAGLSGYADTVRDTRLRRATLAKRLVARFESSAGKRWVRWPLCPAASTRSRRLRLREPRLCISNSERGRA